MQMLFLCRAMVLLFCFSFVSCQTFEVLNSFRWLNFTFENSKDYQNYISKKIYEHCPLAGIKLDKSGNIYVSSPRWVSKDCPATLMKLNKKLKCEKFEIKFQVYLSRILHGK
jgi:hypothetical protein